MHRTITSRALVLAGVCGLAAGAANAGAGVIYVNGASVPPGDGRSWGSAFSDLQDALRVARPGDQVWVAQGTYYPGPSRIDSFRLADGVAIYGGFTGVETRLWERDIVNRTVLSGDIDRDGTPAGNSYSVVAGWDVAGATLSSCWIEGGNADGRTDLPPAPENCGGAVFLYNSTVRIEQCRFLDNQAASGGAVYIAPGPDETQVDFWRCFFTRNTANGRIEQGYGEGGAICIDSLQYLVPVVTIDRCHFTRNQANVTGGAINFDGNDAGRTGRLLVSNTVFSTNSAAGAGGGVYSGCCCDVWVLNSSFWNNFGQNGGGATYIKGKLANSVLWRNTRAGGASDRLAQTGPGTLLMEAYHNNIQAYDGVYTGSGNFNIDPLFVDPDGRDNTAGTLDDSLAIRPTSPCVQRGRNDLVVGPLDFPGNRRISPARRGQPVIVDVGAYEITPRPGSVGGSTFVEPR